MTVDNELIKVGGNLVINHGDILSMPEWTMPEFINSTIPTEADLVTASTTQKYPIGTQLRKDGKLFRYCKAGAALSAGERGFLKCNYFLVPGSAGNSANSGFEGAPYAAITAGDTSFSIADTAAAKNEYEGAELVLYDDTNAIYDEYRIIGNDATDETTTKLYIASPGFKHAATTSVGITIYRNPYMGVRTFATGGGYASALGYVKLAVASGSFFWLQTAGIITGVTGASTWPGQTQYNRDVFANTDGSLIGADNSTTVIMYQRVGFLLGRTASDYGDNCIMLQLDQ